MNGMASVLASAFCEGRHAPRKWLARSVWSTAQTKRRRKVLQLFGLASPSERHMSNQPDIRPLSLEDAAALGPLIRALGYSADGSAVVRRVGAILAAPAHHAFVASADQSIIGFLHCFERPALEKTHDLVVQALVVDASYRRAGVGAALMGKAEALARQTGCQAISLSSRSDRAGAHAFYTQLGYAGGVSARIFTKDIAPGSSTSVSTINNASK
jgi:GNAT superfamily N-acetyltransferase